MDDVKLAHKTVKVPGAFFGDLFISIERLCELNRDGGPGPTTAEERAALEDYDLNEVICSLAHQLVYEPDDADTASLPDRGR